MRHYEDQVMATTRHYADQGMATIRHYADQSMTTMRHYAETAVMVKCCHLKHIQMVIRNDADGDMMITHHRAKLKIKARATVND